MVYLKILKWTNDFNYNFTYGFDSLNGTELEVSSNAISVHFPIGHSVTIIM